jgi:hypothetical protein
MTNNLDDRGGRIYNGLPSELMNKLYDGLVDRYGSIDELTDAIPNWATFSLYLARTCGVIERNKKRLPVCGWFKSNNHNDDGECLYEDSKVLCDNCIVMDGKQIPKGMKYV